MSDLGKKVIFLYPPSVIHDEMVTRLVDQEYEVYTLRDVTAATYILKKYPDSIVYVNIDAGLSEKEWETWIVARMADPATKDVGFGIVSYNTDETLQKKYLMDIGIGYGFIKLKLGLDESTKILLAMLKASEAKGRRKYVRATCERDNLATINLREGPTETAGQICDISVVGLSCILDPDPSFKKNSVLHDIQLKLRASLIKTEAIVFGTRVDENGKTVYVLLFTKRLDDLAREKIRVYIQTALQMEMQQQADAITQEEKKKEAPKKPV